MFVLEHYAVQGAEKYPRYKWKQYIIGGNKELLERIRGAQRRPNEWRVVELTCEPLSLKKTA